ncbi:hypothetical protein [Pseudomonas fluorescens]|jgi:hypothetical protein
MSNDKNKSKWNRLLSAFDKPIEVFDESDKFEDIGLAALSVDPDSLEENSKSFDEVIIEKSGFDVRKHYEELYWKYLKDHNLLRSPDSFSKDKILGVKLFISDENGKAVDIPLSKFNPITQKTTFSRVAETNATIIEAEFLNLLAKGHTKFYPNHKGKEQDAIAFLTVAYHAGLKAGVAPDDIVFPKKFSNLKAQLMQSGELNVVPDALDHAQTVHITESVPVEAKQSVAASEAVKPTIEEATPEPTGPKPPQAQKAVKKPKPKVSA